MAFVGNDMFGHHLALAAQSSSSSGGFGSGGFGKSSHGSSVFGPSSSKGHNDHPTGFGQANNSGHGGSGASNIGAYGIQHGLYQRQDSVLTDMTTSKKDRENNPWIYSSHSMPGHTHHGETTSVYAKPMEKPRRPSLVKQHSMSVPDNALSRMRAPSLSSDPIGMRSRTISNASASSGPKKLTRSMSLVDDLTTPMNMDLARSVFKRQQTIDDAKAKKRSESIKNPKKHILPYNLLQKLKNRRSSKSNASDKDSPPSTPYSQRSRSNTVESKRVMSDSGVLLHHEPEVPERSLSEPIQKQVAPVENEAKPNEEPEKKVPKPQNKQEELILSLLGPEQPPEDEDAVFLGDPDIMDDIVSTNEQSPNKTNDHSKVNVEASTLPLRKLQGGSNDNEDATSQKSGKFTPRSISSNASRRSSKESPVMVHCQPLLDQPDDKDRKSSPNPEHYLRPISPLTILTNQMMHDENLNLKKAQLMSPSPSPLADSMSRRSSASTVPRSSTSSLPSPKLKKMEAPQRQSPQLFNEDKPCRGMVSEASNTSPSLFKTEKPRKLPLLLIPSQQNRYYTYCPGTKEGKLVMYIDPSDSESSESYYDCFNNQSDSGSPRQYRQDNALVPRRGKKRHCNRLKQPLVEKNAEDTNSNEDDTTDNEPVRVKEVVRQLEKGKNHPQRSSDQNKSFNEMMKSKRSNCRSPVQIHIARPYQNIVIPQYTQELKADYESKDINSNDTGTTTSIESGYMTSHLQHSPREYNNQKVLQFVNSLPNNPELEERLSRSSHGDYVKNGSISDNESSSDPEPHSPMSEMSRVRCVSGSDTDNYSLNSNVSSARLEVMKILPSPTDVRERVNSEMSKQSNRASPALSEPVMGRGHSPFNESEPMKYATRVRKNNHGSETELMKLCGNDVKDNVSEIDENYMTHSVHLPHSARTSESRLYKHGSSRYSTSSYSHRFFDHPFLSFRSTHSGYNNRLTNCIDLLLHVLNTLLFLASVAVLTIGIWLVLKNFNAAEVTAILDNNLLEVICYIAIAGAALAILAAACLCCGIRKDKFGLGFYAFVLVLVVCIFTTASVLSAIFADKLYGIEFRFNFQDRLAHKYGNLQGSEKMENEFFTSAWDTMQIEFQCCGGEGSVNDSKSWALYKKFSIWYRLNPLKATKFVPESCCKKNSNKDICQGSDHNLLGPPVYGPMVELGISVYNQLNPNLNTDGCFGPFASYLSTIATWAALALGCLAGLYFITVMLTWVFCFKNAQDLNESYLDDSLYDLEYLNDNLSEYSEHDHKHKKHAVNHTEVKLLSTPLTMDNPEHDVQLHPVEMEKGELPSGDADERDAASDHSGDNDSDVNLPFTKHVIEDIAECNEESDHSDGSGDGSAELRQDSICRRNIWLESDARAVHLLSIAIQEEDSNLEDSDSDHDQHSAFV